MLLPRTFGRHCKTSVCVCVVCVPIQPLPMAPLSWAWVLPQYWVKVRDCTNAALRMRGCYVITLTSAKMEVVGIILLSLVPGFLLLPLLHNTSLSRVEGLSTLCVISEPPPSLSLPYRLHNHNSAIIRPFTEGLAAYSANTHCLLSDCTVPGAVHVFMGSCQIT